jgi:uncharacterized protein
VVLILVFTIGAMECAHFVNAYQNSCKKYPKNSGAFHASETLRQIFLPIFFATLTTALGFLFNMLSSVKFLQDFAAAISLAIAINTLIICLVLPLLLSILVSDRRKKNEAGLFFSLSNIVIKLHKKTLLHPVTLGLVILLSIIAGAIVAPKIPLEMTPYINFYQDSSVMKKIISTQNHLSGIRKSSIYIESDNTDAFKSRKNLAKLLSVQNKIDKLPETSSTLSIASVAASAYQVFIQSTSDADFIVPYSSEFIDKVLAYAKEVPLTRNLLREHNQAAQITINYQVYSTTDFARYMKKIRRILNSKFRDSSFTYELSNQTVVGSVDAINHIIKIQLVSIGIIYLLVFVVMVRAFKSIKAGLISVASNLVPLSGTLLVMFIFNIPFFTITIVVLASIVGLAVDDTIHIMLSFRKQYKKTQALDFSVAQAIKEQMRPVTITSISLVLAMAVLAFSSLKGVMLFAVLMGLGAFLAWLTDMIVTPFLLRKINICKQLN